MNPVLLICMAVFGVLTYVLAKRKNKMAVVWGIFGALVPLVTLIVLAFAPFLCPKCSKPLKSREFAARQCPHCNARW